MEIVSSKNIDEYLAEGAPLPELKAYLPDFLSKRKTEAEDFKALLENGEFEEVRKICHQWNGFCEPYGFKGLGELGKILELACINEKKESAVETLSLIDQYLVAKKQSLK